MHCLCLTIHSGHGSLSASLHMWPRSVPVTHAVAQNHTVINKMELEKAWSGELLCICDVSRVASFYVVILPSHPDILSEWELDP